MISSIMTWNNTPPNLKEIGEVKEGEEEDGGEQKEGDEGDN